MTSACAGSPLETARNPGSRAPPAPKLKNAAEKVFGCARAKSYADLAEALEVAATPEGQAFQELCDAVEAVTGVRP